MVCVVVVHSLPPALKLVTNLTVVAMVLLGHLVVGDVTFEVCLNKIAPLLSPAPFCSLPYWSHPATDPDLAGAESASRTPHFSSWSSPVFCATISVVLEPARWLFRCVLPLNAPWCSYLCYRLKDVDRR
jgi:hypothetical protein